MPVETPYIAGSCSTSVAGKGVRRGLFASCIDVSQGVWVSTRRSCLQKRRTATRIECRRRPALQECPKYSSLVWQRDQKYYGAKAQLLAIRGTRVCRQARENWQPGPNSWHLAEAVNRDGCAGTGSDLCLTAQGLLRGRTPLTLPNGCHERSIRLPPSLGKENPPSIPPAASKTKVSMRHPQ